MKKEYIFLILFTSLLGIFIGVQFKGNYQDALELSFLDKELMGEINKVKMENKELLLKKEYLHAQLEILEKNEIKDETGKKLKKKAEALKALLGYKNVQGPGLIITIDTTEENNLGELFGEFIERKKLLITLVNEIKRYGGESISINEQRISPYSEITLAGNHININSIPIVQPYEIKVIGDKKRLDKYIHYDNELIHMMKNIFKLKVNIIDYDNLIIPKVEREKKLKYVKAVKEI